MNYEIKLTYPKELQRELTKINSICEDLKTYISQVGLDKHPLIVQVIINGDVYKYGQLTKNGMYVYMHLPEMDEKKCGAFMFNCRHLNEKEFFGLKNIIILMSTQTGVPKAVNESGSNETCSPNTPTDDEDNLPDFVAVTPKFKLSNMILNDSTKRQLDRAITLIRNTKLIYDNWGFKEIDPNTKTILCFYGAPGTGKTMCANALAYELGKKIMFASYASIESKWVGEGPKNLRKIFQDATEQDAVLFFDEADSFLSKRVENAETGSDKHYNRMSNEMFQLLENYDGVIIFATNLVTDFDKAFKSRILAFIDFELPDKDTRAKMIKLMTPKGLPMARPLNEEELHTLSATIDGFSGREIRKGMLTVLSDGAMRGVSNFTFDDFKIGFESVKKDTEAIEASMNGNKKMGNAIEDFIKYGDQNSAIIEIIMNAIWQDKENPDSAKAELFKICKLLNIDTMPDVHTKPWVTDLDSSASKLIGTGRESECMRYCSDILAHNSLSEDVNQEYISILGNALHVSNINGFIAYMNSVKQLNI